MDVICRTGRIKCCAVSVSCNGLLSPNQTHYQMNKHCFTNIFTKGESPSEIMKYARPEFLYHRKDTLKCLFERATHRKQAIFTPQL